MSTSVASIMLAWGLSLLGLGFLVKYYPKDLSEQQRNLIQDILIVLSVAMAALWLPIWDFRITVAGALLMASLGLYMKLNPLSKWSHLFYQLSLCLIVALLGERIFYINWFGDYLFFTKEYSFVVTFLWYFAITRTFSSLDDVRGAAGGVVFLGSLIFLSLVVYQEQGLNEALLMGGVMILVLLIFKDRLLGFYSHLGEPLATFWGFMLAGLSIFGAVKGAAALTILVPMVVLGIPIMRLSLTFVSSRIFHSKKWEFMGFYHWLISRGVNHVEAVVVIQGLTLFMGLSVIFLYSFPNMIAGIIIAMVSGLILYLVAGLVHGEGGESPQPRSGFWNVYIDNISFDYALTKVLSFFGGEAGDKPAMIVTPDALALLLSRSDDEYRNILRDSSLVVPDGVGVVLAMRLLGLPVRERIPGVELFMAICRLAAVKGWRIFLYGGKPGVAEKTAERLSQICPNIKIVGAIDGYTGEPDFVASSIKESRADILFTALGVPKQEKWLKMYLPATGVRFGMGVGGSFDVVAGNLKRAPVFWRKMGLEWLYRTIQEPKRIKRVVKLPIFVILVILTRIGVIPMRSEAR